MGMLDILILLLIVSWLGGLSVQAGGGMIHLLLVIALLMFIFRRASGRRA